MNSEFTQKKSESIARKQDSYRQILMIIGRQDNLHFLLM